MTIDQALVRTNALRSQSDSEWHEYLDLVISVLKSQNMLKDWIRNYSKVDYTKVLIDSDDLLMILKEFEVE